ncbi:uncharacterized protein LOC143019328 [Oratosquilla oratoria]|uniref:uncharacterized protein LOC143019328 n=1 Tax=Oratosquilla oratoria TaxID=337810 RepID=UPI003F7647D5
MPSRVMTGNSPFHAESATPGSGLLSGSTSHGNHRRPVFRNTNRSTSTTSTPSTLATSMVPPNSNNRTHSFSHMNRTAVLLLVASVVLLEMVGHHGAEAKRFDCKMFCRTSGFTGMVGGCRCSFTLFTAKRSIR